MIELIVVIAIISILAVALITVLNPLTQFAKARDTQRRTELKHLQSALEQYYNDNGFYPTTGGEYYSSDPGDYFKNNLGGWIPGITPKYIQSLPSDPSGGNANCPTTAGPGTKRAFLYRSDSVQYVIITCPEVTASLNNPKDSLYDPTTGHSDTAWKVCMGETACSSW